MPDLVGALDHRDPVGLGAGLRRVEEAELDAGRVVAEQGEVDAGPVPGGTEGIGAARPRPERVGPHFSEPAPAGSVRLVQPRGPDAQALEALDHPARRPPVTPGHAGQCRDGEHRSQVLQDVAREVARGNRRARPPNGLGSSSASDGVHQSLEPGVNPGDAPPAGLDERARLRHEHEGVPRRPGGQARARVFRGGLLDEPPDRADGSPAGAAEYRARLDPPVLRLRGRGRGPQEDDAPGVLVHEGGRLGNLAHESLFLEDEVVRRKHGHGGAGSPAQDPVRRQEHARAPFRGRPTGAGWSRRGRASPPPGGLPGSRH